jgi:hypothetical protein
MLRHHLAGSGLLARGAESNMAARPKEAGIVIGVRDRLRAETRRSIHLRWQPHPALWLQTLRKPRDPPQRVERGTLESWRGSPVMACEPDLGQDLTA